MQEASNTGINNTKTHKRVNLNTQKRNLNLNKHANLRRDHIYMRLNHHTVYSLNVLNSSSLTNIVTLSMLHLFNV